MSELSRIFDSFSDAEVLMYFECPGHVTIAELERRYMALMNGKYHALTAEKDERAPRTVKKSCDSFELARQRLARAVAAHEQVQKKSKFAAEKREKDRMSRKMRKAA